MDLAAGELPDEPGVYGAEEELPGICPLSGAGDLVQQPLDLGAGKIGVRHKAGFHPDLVPIALLYQPLDDIRGPAALPDDGVGDGLSRLFIPDHGGLPLVRNADGRDIQRRDAQLRHGRAGDLQRRVPDLQRVVLHPARLGVYLPEFLLGGRTDISRPVKKNAAGAGRSLVKGHDIVHRCFSFNFRVSVYPRPNLKEPPLSRRLRERKEVWVISRQSGCWSQR